MRAICKYLSGGTTDRLRTGGVMAVLALGLTCPAQAQQIIADDGVLRFSRQALATYGFIAIPNDSASLLAVKSTDRSENRFYSMQLGGGFRLSEEIPIYLEGYFGFQRYDPQFILKGSSDDLTLRADWNGVGVTGGVGWDIRLNENWSLRPVANLSIGKVASDVSLLSAIVKGEFEDELDFLENGDITVGGYGASLILNYQLRKREYDIDFRLRHTDLRLRPIGGSGYLDTSARAKATTAFWRARVPIKGWRAFGGPVRSVWQFSASSFPGDQGDIIGLDWLAKVGVGLELDTENIGLPIVSRARVLVRYAFGEDYKGYSIGLGISF